MNHRFPLIREIGDVLPAIAGSPEFIVAEKPGYKVVNYMVSTEGTFPPVDDSSDHAAIRRECRGIKFDSETGKIIARPYHKFFNVNERAETASHLIDLRQNHDILNKLDGSMVHPMYVNGNMRWATKMGITDTSMNAEVFVARNPDYVDFARDVLYDSTPIFEWCSRNNKIVLDYPEDSLVLTAVRNMHTGKYLDYLTLKLYSAIYDIPVVENSEHTLDQIHKAEDTEGIVIRFYSGHMLKAKSAWYVLRHKSKDAIMREKNVFEYIFTEKVDDVCPYLTEEDSKKLCDFKNEVIAKMLGIATSLECQFIDMVAETNGNRKAFAAMNTGPFKGLLFKALDGHNIYDGLLKLFASKCGTQAGIDSIKPFLDGLEWKY